MQEDLSFTVHAHWLQVMEGDWGLQVVEKARYEQGDNSLLREIEILCKVPAHMSERANFQSALEPTFRSTCLIALGSAQPSPQR
jgi:hypothetical protein